MAHMHTFHNKGVVSLTIVFISSKHISICMYHLPVEMTLYGAPKEPDCFDNELKNVYEKIVCERFSKLSGKS